MSFLRFATTLAAVTVTATIATANAAAQTTAQTAATKQPAATPQQQQLQQAHTILNGIDSRAVSGDTARKLQTLRQDFGALESAYNEQLLNGPAGNTAPGAMSTAGEKDWRVRYSSLTSDLRDLIGGDPSEAVAAATPATGAADLDPRMKEQLQQFRTVMQNFAGTGAPAPTTAAPSMTAPAAAPPPVSTATPANNTAADARQTSDVAALLNRIEDIVNAALKNTSVVDSAKAADSRTATTAVGTTGVVAAGSASNKVTIDRDKLEEIRAEVEQLKRIVKP